MPRRQSNSLSHLYFNTPQPESQNDTIFPRDIPGLKIDVSKSKHIVAIEPSGNLYGSEYCLLDVLKNASTNAFRWSVITTRGSFSELLRRDCPQIKVAECLPVHLHKRNSISKSVSYTRFFCTLYSLRPDVIYVNQSGILRICHLFARILRLPIVCQVQTLEDAKSLSVGSNYPLVKSFIFNSHFLADSTDCDPFRKSTLYQGISSASPVGRLQHPNNGNNQLRLGILGRIGESKGHYLLAETAKLLSDRSVNFSIRVIGDGISPAATAKWENYLIEKNVRHFFELRGYQRDIREELACVDLLLIPSIAEPLGRVLFDAANLQVPAIVSDAGGLGEISAKYDLGIRFRSGDTISLADAILGFRNSPEFEIAKFSKNSKRLLVSLSMRSYISCIESILSDASQFKSTSRNWLGDEIDPS